MISTPFTRGAAAALALALPGLAGCGGDDTPAPAAPPLTRFEPAGCGFAVAPRAEYADASAGRTDVGATPNIRRVRLGLGGNVARGAAGRADPSTSIGVAWQTDDGTLVSEVAWGSSPDPASWPKENRTSGYTWLTPPGQINPLGEARMHEAYVCGLSPDTTYYYRVGGGPEGKEVWSEVYSFKTTPSDPGAEVTFAVTGDSRGQGNDAWRLIQRRVLAEAVDLQLFSGDMVDLATDQKEWEKWIDEAWKDDDGSLLTLGQVLTFPAHGNHENHSSIFYGNIVMPQDLEKFPKYTELFFSVDVGPVHVVVIDDGWIVNPADDTEFAGVFGPWLRDDLQAANENRAQVPWIVAMHHHSAYSSSNHGQDADVLRGRAFFGPIYDEFHVDLVLAGHDHNYERTKPLTTGPDGLPTVQASPADGTVYVVCAGSGADPYSKGTSDFTEISLDYLTAPLVGFYGTLTATQAALTFEAHELRLDASDPVVDTLSITK
jgi:hypothetical protein